jgi:CelD/BcsL family acetyltransferase involved in cellulose biosynthesis
VVDIAVALRKDIVPQAPTAITPELRLEPLDDIDGRRGEWNSLAEQARNPFSTWEWASTWWRHFGEGHERVVMGARDASDRLVALIPLCVTGRGPLRVMRFIGYGPADRLGPICDAAAREAVAHAFEAVLSEPPLRWSVLLGDHFPSEQGWSMLLGATILARDASPLLRFEGRSWDEFLAARSTNFRQQVRRRERKLSKSFDLRFRLSDDAERLHEDFSTLVRLHELRWSGGGSEAFPEKLRAFHEEFAASALEQGWLRLWLLELDGEPVAAWYGLRFAGADWFYQSGRDPAFEDLNVGFVLMAHTVRDAAEAGMSEYHLLRGDEPYKARFASEDPGLETIAVGRGRLARTSLAAAAALPGRGPRAARRLIGGV